MRDKYTIEDIYGLSNKYVSEIKRKNSDEPYRSFWKTKKEAIFFLIKTIYWSLFDERVKFESFRILKISESPYCISYVERINKSVNKNRKVRN